MPRTITYSERAIEAALSQWLAPRVVEAVMVELRRQHGVGTSEAPKPQVTAEDVERAKARLRRMGVQVD